MNSTTTLTWTDVLAAEKQKAYFEAILSHINAERRAGKIIYPKTQDMFNAFKLTPFNNVKVVILGQDPYHGPKQAHGLSFSVPAGIKPPPSLMNIFKELQDDLGLSAVQHGNLSAWATQGVMLLNTSLSVEAHQAASHSQLGWQTFTDTVISALDNHPENLVFMLWGGHARKKKTLIQQKRHLIIESAHPSPLSAYRGFFGSKPFSRCNSFLVEQGQTPIDWQLKEA